MALRNLLEFKTDIPDDTIEDDREIVQYGGRTTARVIGEMLAEQGYSVGEPECADEHGWETTAKIVQNKRKTRVWFRVTLLDDVLLIVEDTTFTIFGKTDATMFRRTLTRLNEQLVKDGRFRDLRWHTPASYEAQGLGYPYPVD